MTDAQDDHSVSDDEKDGWRDKCEGRGMVATGLAAGIPIGVHMIEMLDPKTGAGQIVAHIDLLAPDPRPIGVKSYDLQPFSKVLDLILKEINDEMQIQRAVKALDAEDTIPDITIVQPTDHGRTQ